MMTARDARLAYALLKIRQAQISKALAKIQPYTEQEPGDRNAARLGEARLGFVQTTDPEAHAAVTDIDLFTKWVQAKRPDEIVPSVRESFKNAVLKELDGKGALVDWDGEEVPGVAFASSTPAQRFQAAPDAAELAATATAEDLPFVDGVDLASLLGISREDGEPGD